MTQTPLLHPVQLKTQLTLNLIRNPPFQLAIHPRFLLHLIPIPIPILVLLPISIPISIPIISMLILILIHPTTKPKPRPFIQPRRTRSLHPPRATTDNGEFV